VHPKILKVADTVLRPQEPRAPDAAPKEITPPVALRPLEDGSSQLVWSSADDPTAPHCHHYTVGASVMLEIGGHREEHPYLHRENAIYQPYIDRLHMREYIMSTMWAGTEFTAENGGTRLVPGSHRWPEERLAKPDEIVQAVMPKGSVVLWALAHPARCGEKRHRRTPHRLLRLLHRGLVPAGGEPVRHGPPGGRGDLLRARAPAHRLLLQRHGRLGQGPR
jgi:hypothetical protein